MAGLKPNPTFLIPGGLRRRRMAGPGIQQIRAAKPLRLPFLSPSRLIPGYACIFTYEPGASSMILTRRAPGFLAFTSVAS
ncbi:hypothetical protein C8N35_10578 [Breoghania corrubedonensis]|uniref:Uncharacterized protein n=1 Tax=Breoghania corrubedonensis TaxID=665038 RepID=A0A2T5V8J0_9HYPH|nr:hypothetical protein C8N35_10578 [Breoghania corrubedonensis]